jgi:histidinol-phosphatase (PHP family)
MRVDLHNHTTLSNHSTGTIDEYILKAIEIGIDIYGFTDHAPMGGFDKVYRISMNKINIYEDNILYLKDIYKNDIEILLGYEVDYMPQKKYFEKNILNADVDYLIGSVHFLNGWGFDNPAYIKNYKNKNIDQVWIDYFKEIKQLAKSNYFNIIGHLDLIKVFNFLPKKDIKLIAQDAMKEIKKSNMVLEINTSGLRKPINEIYPSKALLELAYELDIQITFSSDAHKIGDIGFKYDEAVQLAKSVGYEKCVSFRKKDKIIHNF